MPLHIARPKCCHKTLQQCAKLAKVSRSVPRPLSIALRVTGACRTALYTEHKRGLCHHHEASCQRENRGDSNVKTTARTAMVQVNATTKNKNQFMSVDNTKVWFAYLTKLNAAFQQVTMDACTGDTSL